MSTVDYRGANQTRTLFGQVMWYVAATAGFFALGSYLGRGLGYGWGFAFFIVAFGCLIGMQFAARSSPQRSVAILFGLGLSPGLAISPPVVCFGALLALIIFGVVLIFVHIPAGAVIYSILGLLIFAGLTMADFQRLRRSTDLNSAPLIAASIFLDAVNVFQLFLPLFGRSRD